MPADTYMTDLPEGARFIGPDRRTEYQVLVPASAHERGWVEVRNLSRTIEDALPYADPQHIAEGGDPRDGVFCFSHPVHVEVIA